MATFFPHGHGPLVHNSHSTERAAGVVESDEGGPATMSKNERHTPRTPATKFPHLQKKLQKQKVQVKQAKKR